MTVAFVAGATGFVGRAVVEQLRQRGVATVAHVRPDSKRRAEWQQKLGEIGAQVDSSPWDVAMLTEALKTRAVTHVFVCIGTTRAQTKANAVQGDPYEAVDYGLTRMLCDAAVAAGTSPRIVYLSSIGTGPTSRSPYFRARWKAEEAVRGSGLPWVIARPSIIAGAGEGARRDDGRPLEKVAAVVADGVLAAVGLVAARTRARYRSITPETLADALVRLGLDGTPGTVFEGDDLRQTSS
jgi:uncharacterized protein YbjT (DUF2867 family)